MILIWDMCLMTYRFALGPLLIWMALELNGMNPWKIGVRKFILFISLPLFLAALALFTNELHHGYWVRIWFEGRILVVERGLLSILTAVYCQSTLVVGAMLFLAGVPKHFGDERIRLILFLACYAIIYLGDTLWRLGIPMPQDGNPLSLSITFASYLVSVSVFLFGFPRAQSPIPQDLIVPAAKLRGALPFGDVSARDGLPRALDGIPGLSERQREIVTLVIEGRHYREIAQRLGLTERTVKYHMSEILDKCGLETRDQLIAWIAVRRAQGI